MRPPFSFFKRSHTFSNSPLSSRTPYTSYQSQWETPKTSANCILVSESPGKTQCSQALDGTILSSHREKTEQDQVQFGSWSPRAIGALLAANAGQFTHVCLFCASLGGSYPFLSQDRHISGLAKHRMLLTLKQNKRAYSGLTTEKDIPTQNDKPNAGCVSADLLVRKGLRPKVHSHDGQQGSQD